MIVEVEKAYEHVSEESKWLLFVILPWIEVVVTIVFFLFLFCPIRGKETDKSLIVEAMVANSFSTTLIFFFKSSIREFEDEKV